MFIFLASSDLELLELLRHLCTIAKLKMQTFYLSFLSTNVLLGSIFIHMKARQFCIYGDVFYVTLWRNLQYPHNCHTWKAEISPFIILVILVTNMRSVKTSPESCLYFSVSKSLKISNTLKFLIGYETKQL